MVRSDDARPSISRPEADRDPLFLRACRGESIETTPIWFMRQAGRYLPEYRRLRERFDFLTAIKTPDVAVEVTLQPVRRFGMDAAILFSDILVPAEAMGVKLTFEPGPVIDPPVRTESDVRRLGRPDPEEDLGFVQDAIRALRRELPASVALIGFAGAPFTLAAYLVEGGKSKDYLVLKSLMFQEPLVFHSLMEKLSLVVSDSLEAQIAAGVHAVQLFDTWSGLLSPHDYREQVLPHVRRIVARVRRAGVPFILYGNGAGGLLELMDETGADVIGVDWRTSLSDARRRLGPERTLQGNLDPGVLMAPSAVLRDQARRVLLDAGIGAPHVFNLGHGLVPTTPVDAVAELVRFVHEEGRRLRSPSGDGENEEAPDA